MKKLTVKLLTSLATLIITFTLIFSLASCLAGSEDILSKEELAENISSETDTSLEYVYKYLDKWSFPEFSAGKLKRVENLFRDNFYKDLPEAYTLAQSVSKSFLDSVYESIDLSDSDAVTDALISAYVKAIGDKYSYYRTPTQYESYKENLSGSFVGIGVNVKTKLVENGIYVSSPIEGSPAEKAGVIAGDIITEIDGESVASLGYDGAVAKLKGKKGTAVNVTVRREAESIQFSIVRNEVVNSTVRYYINENKIGYIDIDSFKANTDELFIEAIDYMKTNGALAIVYDVRDNGGGYLDSVLHMIDYISPDGITLASYTNDYEKDYVAKDGNSLCIPTVVLCNEDSASAAELFTAGIRDIGEMGHYSVTVVGKTTYGKGVMQSSYTLSDKSAITMTVAFYNPPSGKNYDGVGIIPDVVIDGFDDQLDEAFNQAEIIILK